MLTLNSFSLLDRFKKSKNPKDVEAVAEIEKNILKRKAQLHEIEQSLPRKSGFYLQVGHFICISQQSASYKLRSSIRPWADHFR